MRLLDLFCGAGGAAMGYARAGFDVVGVDIEPQPHYPFEFIQVDALTFPLEGFDVIHASPVCKGYSVSNYIHQASWPLLIPIVRERLQASGKPWIIENVEGAKQHLPGSIVLCGSMFGLGVKRHRLFESNVLLFAPGACRSHRGLITVFGHDASRVVAGQRISYGIEAARRSMAIDWMNRDELAQAIPPAYTEYLGQQLLNILEREVA